jgi:hypothetical protein
MFDELWHLQNDNAVITMHADHALPNATYLPPLLTVNGTNNPQRPKRQPLSNVRENWQRDYPW